ncbi:MAG TPA: alpha/beta fold hydrolase [Sphingobium sp.]|nr:alpha/beta fold hydrolase [Sphingobium sp.]
MASFLMIHGAWHGGWCFDRLRAPLAAAGHAMLAPDLPGMGGSGDGGGDARALAAVTLDGWARFVVERAGALPGPVILCGHSRGGIVISSAAERAPECFAGLVYIAAMLVPDGRSLYDMRAGGPADAAFDAGLSPVAGGLAVALAPDVATAHFCHRASPADQAMVAARLCPEPVRPLGTRLRLTEARYGRLPRHYIACRHDRTIPLALQQAMQAGQPCASVTTLESDHSPFLGAPEQLAAALITIAERMEQ